MGGRQGGSVKSTSPQGCRTTTYRGGPRTLKRQVQQQTGPIIRRPIGTREQHRKRAHSSRRIFVEAKTKTVVLDMGLDVKNLDNGMKVTVREQSAKREAKSISNDDRTKQGEQDHNQPAWFMYNLGHLGTDACQPPIEITTLLYHGHQAHPKTASSQFGRRAHARQPSFECIAMLYCGPCSLPRAFLSGHSTKQTPGTRATAPTKYFLTTSSKRKYL